MDTFEDKIQSLKQELRYYEEQINNQLNAINTSAKIEIDLRNDPRNAVPLLQSDILALLKDSQKTRSYFDEHSDSIRECESLMETIKVVVSVAELIAKCESAVNSYDLVNSSRLVNELAAKVKLLPKSSTEIGSGSVCVHLRRESQIIIYRQHSRLRRLIQKHCIVIEKGRIIVNKQLKGILHDEETILKEQISLATIWNAILTTQQSQSHAGISSSSKESTIIGSHLAQEIVDSLISSLWSSVLCPLWKERKSVPPRIICGEDHSILEFECITNGIADSSASAAAAAAASSAGSVSANIAAASIGVACRMPFHQLLELISTVFNFVWNEMFCSMDPLSVRMGTALQSNNICLSKTLALTLHALIPKAEGELPSFQKSIEKSCKEFDVRLDTYCHELTSAEYLSVDKLSNIITQLHVHFGTARRREVLSRARELIVADYHNTMLASGDALEDDPASAGLIGDPSAQLEQSGSFALQLLRFESCQISLASCRLLKLIHEILKQACSGSAEMAAVLYEISRDCLELFMAVIPTKFPQILSNSPRMGAVFFNDCCYIAHNSTLISHTYRQELGVRNNKLLGCVGFVDFIPRYRSLGESVIGKHIESQKQILIEFVSKMNVYTEVGAQQTTAAAVLLESSRGGVGVGTAASKLNVNSVLSFGFSALSNVLSGVAANSEESSSTTITTVGTGTAGASTAAANSNANSTAKLQQQQSQQPGEYNDKKAAVQLVKHFEWLQSQWQGVLQDTAYERIMSYLVDAVVRVAMKPVLEAECITERAGLDISALFRIMQDVKNVFLANQSKSADPDAVYSISATLATGTISTSFGNSGSGSNTAANETNANLSVSWKKFCALADVLEYNLNEVAEWLPRKKFSSFTVSEMVSLIKALFDDSVKRDAIITKIQEISL